MYLYFDSNGTLLETINDEALRQYNTDVNIINVFIEDENNVESGRIPQDIISLKYWFQLPDGEILNNGYSTSRENNFIRETIPFDRNRDLKFFSYGKLYDFFTIKIPSNNVSKTTSEDGKCVSFATESGVFNCSGTVLTTIQAIYEPETEEEKDNPKCLSLERVAFTVENSVLLPDRIVNGSEFNWLLNQYILGAHISPSLVYKKTYLYPRSIESMDSGVQQLELSISDFNRRPEIDESFILTCQIVPSEKSYMAIAQVVLIDDDNATATVEFKGSDTILIGDGPVLTYRKIDEWSEDDISQAVQAGEGELELRQEYFNRRPIVRERFLYLYYIKETAKTYIANATVTNILSGKVMIVIGNVETRCITGENALIYSGATIDVTDYTANRIFDLELQNFNRTPIVGESFMALCKTQSVSAYIATFIISSVLDDKCSVYYKEKFYVKGEQGEIGETPDVIIRATVNNEIGTPSVEVEKGGTKEAPSFTFEFKNIKGETGKTGEQGPKGNVGDTPNISINATVDNEVGTPTVAVSKSGTVSSPVFSFEFKNIKGETGKTGNIGAQGVKGDTGETALVCKKIASGTSAPQVNHKYYFYSSPLSIFNRTPIIEETFSLIYEDQSTNDIYMCIAQIEAYSDSRIDYSIVYRVSIMGDTGPTGPQGVDVSTIEVETPIVDDEYTTTPIVFNMSDGTKHKINVTARNAFNPNTIAFMATVSASAWKESTVYSDYGYNYSALISAPTSDKIYAISTYVPEVVPVDVADINDINFAPFASTGEYGVLIYARQKPTTTKSFNILLSHIMS